MKKNIFALCALFVFIFTIISCDNATSTSSGYFSGLYTVERNFLYPESIDTFYKVENIADFGLKDGDRAYLEVAYEIDNYYGPAMAKYRIQSVISVLPVYNLTATSNVDPLVYSSPISGLEEVLVNTYMADAMWLWKKYQNVSVGYYSNGTEGDFKLSPVKLSGDTLCFALNAKIEDGEQYMTKILSFDISSAVNMLPDEDAKKFVKLDSIYTKITILRQNKVNDNITTMSPYGGKYKNYFKE